MDIVKSIRKEVIKRCQSKDNKFGFGAWTHHISSVVDIALELARRYKADLEIVQLAALLHDIASVTNENMVEDHHLHGAAIADELLTGFNYPQQRIEHIKDCILAHRGSKIKEKKTIEAVCLADADALAHLYNIPSLFSLVYHEMNMGIDEGAKYIEEKLIRGYNKLSDRTKALYKDEYAKRISILKDKKRYFS